MQCTWLITCQPNINMANNGTFMVSKTGPQKTATLYMTSVNFVNSYLDLLFLIQLVELCFFAFSLLFC